MVVNDYEKFRDRTNKYDYINAELAGTEIFEQQESFNLDFVGLPIEYDSFCVNSTKVDNFNTTLITTDIKGIQENLNPNISWFLFINCEAIASLNMTPANGGKRFGHYI